MQDKLVGVGFLRPSDQFCTDKAGNTLLMVAAHAGSQQSMRFLLSQPHCPINAQNHKVGTTAGYLRFSVVIYKD